MGVSCPHRVFREKDAGLAGSSSLTIETKDRRSRRGGRRESALREDNPPVFSKPSHFVRFRQVGTTAYGAIPLVMAEYSQRNGSSWLYIKDHTVAMWL